MIHLKQLKTSSFIFTIIIFFLIIDAIGYKILYNNTISSHEKETKILFYEIQNETTKLLTNLSYNYELQKDNLHQKHQEVLTYLRTHSYDDPLDNIYDSINNQGVGGG